MAIGDKLGSPGGQDCPQLGTGEGHRGAAVVPKVDGGTLRCPCGLPFARLQSGYIVVQSKHYGKLHVNSVALWDLLRMVLESS